MSILIVKIRTSYLSLIGIIWLFSVNIYANESLIGDTIDHTLLISNRNFKTKALDIKSKPDLFINISAGAYLNKTLGIHPIINIPVGINYINNRFILDYERRFGKSKQEYFILENNSLKSTNAYNGQCIGVAYERILYNSDFHMILLHSGLGYDWFAIPKNDIIQNNKNIGGLNLNLGIGYSFFFNKKHGPSTFIIYNHSDLRNGGGTRINSNSITIRLSYNFGHELYKEGTTDGWIVHQSIRQD